MENNNIEAIRQMIYDGETDRAISLLNDYLKENPQSDEGYYLLGNAWRKKGNNRLALNNYLEAIHLNPNSPAQKAHDMLMDILDFYYKEKICTTNNCARSRYTLRYRTNQYQEINKITYCPCF